MTAKGIAALRKRFAHVGNMDPQSLKRFEGDLISYCNTQSLAQGRTIKERAIQEIDPVLKEAQNMLDIVQIRLRKLR